eukprot:1696691-Prymnesium_polylepis.1
MVRLVAAFAVADQNVIACACRTHWGARTAYDRWAAGCSPCLWGIGVARARNRPKCAGARARQGTEQRAPCEAPARRARARGRAQRSRGVLRGAGTRARAVRAPHAHDGTAARTWLFVTALAHHAHDARVAVVAAAVRIRAAHRRTSASTAAAPAPAAA